MNSLELKKLIKECITESLSEYAIGGYSNTCAHESGGGAGGVMSMMEDDDTEYVVLMKGGDYATINGISYNLTDQGCNCKLNFEDGGHKLSVRRDHLPKAIEIMKEAEDDVISTVADRLEAKYFKKK